MILKVFHQCHSQVSSSGALAYMFLPGHPAVKGHPKVSWCFINGQVVASDLQVGFHFFVGETEGCVGGFP